MHVNLMLVVALLAVKRQEYQPEHVERRQQRRGKAECVKRISNVAPSVLVLESAQQNRVLAEKSCKRRKSCDGQSGRQHHHVGPANLLTEPAHAVHVLLAAHGMNYAACGEKKKRLEERVSHQVKNACRKRPNAAREKHIAQLT